MVFLQISNIVPIFSLMLSYCRVSPRTLPCQSPSRGTRNPTAQWQAHIFVGWPGRPQLQPSCPDAISGGWEEKLSPCWAKSSNSKADAAKASIRHKSTHRALHVALPSKIHAADRQVPEWEDSSPSQGRDYLGGREAGGVGMSWHLKKPRGL